MSEKKGALSGLRVIDFGQYVAGPFAAMILGDYGADVIHVDPPGGPLWDEYSGNAVLMRGKRNICLDLKSEKDLAVAKKLAATADVVIENFRPGVMDRLGLGWEDCRKENPALIYCSLPGFSAADKERCHMQGWEGIVSAEGGIYSGRNYFTGEEFIRFNALPLASLFAGVIACHSIAAALIVREKTGLGQHVESSLYDACYEIDSTRGVDQRVSLLPPGVERSRDSINASAITRLMAQYPCADGRYIQTTPPPRGALSLCRALFPAQWLDDAPPENAGEIVREIMLQRSMREWEQYAQEVHGAGVSISLTSEEWLHEPSALDSRSAIHVQDPVLGDTIQPGVPSLMLVSGDSAGQARHLPDADREEILSELETLKPPAVKNTGAAPEPPLKGVKVLDLCQVVAGPTCGRLLAEYGAEVIKINNPRVLDNFTALGGHETQSNGKTTIFLDLKSEQGKRVMDTLIREADVFHCNFAQSAYLSLGFSEEELRQRNPGIIMSQVNIHSLGGGRDWMRGHEDLGEAITGMSMRYGGTLKPDTLPLLVLDHMTGQMGAVGVVLAVYHRMRTGEGQRVQACLSRSSTLAQLPYMLTYEGKAWDEPSGPDTWGFSFADRIYKAKDSYFYLKAEPEALRAEPALSAVDWEREDIDRQLEALFAQGEAAAWLDKLNKNGIMSRRCRIYSKEPPEEAYAFERGISKREEHPGLGLLRTTHCAPRLSLTPPQPGYPSSAPGSDTQRFLEEFEKAHPAH